jgi:hypothetical protein
VERAVCFRRYPLEERESGDFPRLPLKPDGDRDGAATTQVAGPDLALSLTILPAWARRRPKRSMAREFTKKLSSKRAGSPVAPVAGSALARLVCVLARQAARELLMADLPNIPEENASFVAGHDDGSPLKKWEVIR